MLNRVLNDKYYCGLDLGAHRFKVGVVKVKDASTEIVGAFEHAVHGFKNSSVSDLNEFSECISHALTELADKTGIRSKELFVGVDGSLIDVRKSSTAIPLVDRGNKVIAEKDLRRLNKQARLLGVRMEEEVLHEMPQIYEVDDVNSATNPIGLYGRKLAVESLMLVSNVDRIKNILKSINHAGYDVTELYFSSFVAGDLILSDQEKQGGIVMIDIGAKITSVLIFKDGILRHMETIPSGGYSLTCRIAKHLKLSVDLAEEIKRSYATANASQIEPEEEILVKREEAYTPVRRMDIYEAIEEEILELVDAIDQVLTDSGYYGHIHHGVKMIGGGSLLPGLIELIEERTNMPVTLAQINRLNHKNVSNTALYSSAIGLAQKGFSDSMRYGVTQDGKTGWSNRMIGKVKEIYQEYF